MTLINFIFHNGRIVKPGIGVQFDETIGYVCKGLERFIEMTIFERPPCCAGLVISEVSIDV